MHNRVLQGNAGKSDWVTRANRRLRDKDNGAWLAVIDDACMNTNPSSGEEESFWHLVDEAIPECSHGTLLITSRKRPRERFRDYRTLEVGEMTVKEAEALVRAILPRGVEQVRVAQLADLGERTPLALIENMDKIHPGLPSTRIMTSSLWRRSMSHQDEISGFGIRHGSKSRPDETSDRGRGDYHPTDDFTVGWICALPLELAAAQGMLEEKYDARELRKDPSDPHQYSLGQIAGHKIVLTLLISAGNNSAGSAARHLKNTFKNIVFILMVGIGGGIPSPRHDIRLGDVVVSMPSGAYGGVIQYDSGKFLENGQFLRTGALQAPPKDLQGVVKNLEAKHESEESRIATYIEEMLQNNPRNTRAGTDYRRPGRGRDFLFAANYTHKRIGEPCASCDKKRLVARNDRAKDEPVIHYGNIVSGNSVVRSALKRDELGKGYDALCVEMEAAGLMDEGDCLVIRGICDYSDSHKTKEWQRYAAAAAAAYAKELLGEVSGPNITGMSLAPDSIVIELFVISWYDSIFNHSPLGRFRTISATASSQRQSSSRN